MPQPQTIDEILNILIALSKYGGRDWKKDRDEAKQSLADVLLGLPSLQDEFDNPELGMSMYTSMVNERIYKIRQEIAEAFTEKEATNATD